MTSTGIDLKVERVRANIKLTRMAAQIGLSRQALWSLERAAVVSVERAAQYRQALEDLRDSSEAVA